MVTRKSGMIRQEAGRRGVKARWGHSYDDAEDEEEGQYNRGERGGSRTQHQRAGRAGAKARWERH